MGRLIAKSVRGVSESGVLGDPAGASAQQGETLLTGMAARLARDIRAWRVNEQGRLAGRLPASVWSPATGPEAASAAGAQA
jgi:mycofactocin precursor peptide peptidase